MPKGGQSQAASIAQELQKPSNESISKAAARQVLSELNDRELRAFREFANRRQAGEPAIAPAIARTGLSDLMDIPGVVQMRTTRFNVRQPVVTAVGARTVNSLMDKRLLRPSAVMGRSGRMIQLTQRGMDVADELNERGQ